METFINSPETVHNRRFVGGIELRTVRLMCYAIICMLLLQGLGPVSTMAEVAGDRGSDGDDAQVLRIAMRQDMPNFNNFDLNSNSVWKDYVIGKWCWEGLSGLDPGGNVFPRLAEDWTFDETTLTVNITLRDEVKFHDNETMDADDVVFSYTALRDGTTVSRAIVSAFDADGDGTCSAEEIDGTVDSDSDGTFEGVSKVSSTKVKMVMGSVHLQFFQDTLGVPVIPQHIWKDHLTAGGAIDILWNTDVKATIGTGPLYYHSGRNDEFRYLRAFPDYWGTRFNTPSGHWLYPQEVDAINFTLYSTVDAAIQALKGGRVDHIPWTIDHGYMPDLIMDPRTDVATIPDNGYFYLAFNMKREPMNYISFRKAVSHVIDKETIVERYMGGYGQQGDSCLPPFWADWYNSSVKIYPYDLDLAKMELEDGGFTGVGTVLKMPTGRPVPPLVILTPPMDYDPIRVKAGEMIAKELRKLGINVVAKTVDFDTLVSRMNSFDYDMLIIGWSLSSDPVANVFDILGPKSSQNYFGFWGGSVENPWYSHLGGVSTRADAETVNLAVKLHQLGIKAKDTFDRDEQLFYTKWGQGIVSDAVPIDVLYHRVNLLAISTAWSGWIAQFGGLMNVYTIGALSTERVPPPIEVINAILNVPDKLPEGLAIPGNVMVFNINGTPLNGVTVDLTGARMNFSPDNGTTGPDGVFYFNVTGTSHGYATLTADAYDGVHAATTSKVIQVVAGVPSTAFLQVMPDDLFLGLGESTDVVLTVTDGNGDGIAGVDVALDKNLMGYGSVNTSKVTTNAIGSASIMYTAPSSFPMNAHREVRLSLSPSDTSGYPMTRVNTVTQFLVLRNEEASEWHFVSIENVTRVACDDTNDTTVITIKAFDEDGDPLAETIDITCSNTDGLDSFDDSITTNSTGVGKTTIKWADGVEMNSTQVFFKSAGAINSVGAGVSLLYKGNSARDLYGGYFQLEGGGTPLLAPDSGGDLTWEVWVYDLNNTLADVPVSFIIGEPSDGSTTMMVDAPDHLWSSLWDYSSINIFTDADDGSIAAGGYFLSDKMTDQEIASIPNNLYDSWEFIYDDWYGGVVDELEDMTAVQIEDGHWQVQVERDSVVLSDNVPQLIIVPNGVAGFFATPDYANFWWQIDGETAWRTEFVMGRTDTIYSPKYEFDRGILRDYAPGNTTNVDIWVFDVDEKPVVGMGVRAFVKVYGSSPFFRVDASGPTNALGRTSATVTGLTADSGSNPLVYPVRQPMYIQADAAYGWCVLAGVEIFDLPVQLFVDLQVTPITSQATRVTKVQAKATVLDESGSKVFNVPVEFWMDGGANGTSSDNTDANGVASVIFDIPAIPVNGSFNIAGVTASVTKEGYGAASATHSLLSHGFSNQLPVIDNLNIPVTGYETQNTTWNITGRATDDWPLIRVAVDLDGGGPGELDLDGDNWTFVMVDLSVGDHTVNITVTDQWGLKVTLKITFTILPPPNDAPVIDRVSIPDTGYETRDTTWSITGRATDDWSIVLLTASLDGKDPVDLTLTDDTWEFLMVNLNVGEHVVVITVEDEWGLVVVRTLTFTVLPPPNTPPVITGLSIPDTGHETRDTTWSIVVSATDDGPIERVTASLDGGEDVELSISGGEWPFQMSDLTVGEHTVTFTVEDHEGSTDERTVTFTILEPPNLPPSISTLSIPENGYETEDTTFSITGKATDDWTVVRVSASLDGGDPVELSISDDDWSFDLEELGVGEHSVTITVEDEWGLVVSRTITFTILAPPPVNRPTVLGELNILDGHTIEAGEELNISGKVSDDLGLEWVRISLDNGTPVDVHVEGEDWWYLFTDLAAGEHQVRVTARDSHGLEVERTVDLTVREAEEPPPEDEDGTMLYVGIAAAVIVVALLVVFIMTRRRGGA